MNMIQTAIDGVVIVEPRVFTDARGYFFESYSDRHFNDQYFQLCPQMAKAYADVDVDKARSPRIRFVQDNESMSSYGVMRGLHFQMPPFTQSKLVRVVRGAVLDVAVDIRYGSPTYGQHVAVELTEENHRQLFVPRGFAHGFAVLSPTAVFQYKCDQFYAPQADAGINLLDASLAIDWRVPTADAILSEKDKKQPFLRDFKTPFEC